MYLVVTETELTEQFPALTLSSGSVWKGEMLPALVGTCKAVLRWESERPVLQDVESWQCGSLSGIKQAFTLLECFISGF